MDIRSTIDVILTILIAYIIAGAIKYANKALKGWMK